MELAETTTRAIGSASSSRAWRTRRAGGLILLTSRSGKYRITEGVSLRGARHSLSHVNLCTSARKTYAVDGGVSPLAGWETVSTQVSGAGEARGWQAALEGSLGLAS